MQHINQKLSFRSEFTKTYLDAIKSSLEHFTVVENHLDKQATITAVPLPSFVSKANYIAITVLEKIGVIDPTQEQIDTIELLILLTYAKQLTPENFDLCTGTDTIALRSLLRDIDKKIKL